MNSVEEIASRIAMSAAYDTCVVERKHFDGTTRGEPIPIETREEFKQHVLDVLESKETLCFVDQTDLEGKQKLDVYYHPATNTLIILPQDQRFVPSVSRPMDREAQFDRMVDVARYTAGNPDLPIRNSIYELHPELLAPEQRAAQLQALSKADEELRALIEQRSQEELKQTLKRQADELKHTAYRQEAEARHVRELKALEASKQRDFEALRRASQERERQKREEKERQLHQELERLRHQEEDRGLRIFIDKRCDRHKKEAIARYDKTADSTQDAVGDSIRLAKALRAIEEQHERDLKRWMAEREFGRRLQAEEEENRRRKEQQLGRSRSF